MHGKEHLTSLARLPHYLNSFAWLLRLHTLVTRSSSPEYKSVSWLLSNDRFNPSFLYTHSK